MPSGIHTKAPFTRRFTVEELKMHRDNVYRVVAVDRRAFPKNQVSGRRN
jgi:hypothetical protein